MQNAGRWLAGCQLVVGGGKLGAVGEWAGDTQPGVTTARSQSWRGDHPEDDKADPVSGVFLRPTGRPTPTTDAGPLQMDLLQDPTADKQVVTTFAWAGCTAIDFFGALFSDNSDFQAQNSQKQGHTDCSCEQWAANQAGGFHARQRRARSPYKTPLGELGSCRMSEVQRVKVLQGGSTILLLNTMSLAGVPYVHPPCCSAPLCAAPHLAACGMV